MSHISMHKVIKTHAQWYRGDFHAHTHHSDGKLSPADLLAEARQEGLDFFAMTDHNNMDAHDKFGNVTDILIIPGVEVTMAYGHFNVFGLDGVPPAWMASLPKTMEQYQEQRRTGYQEYTPTELLTLTKGSGLYNSINHPLLPPWDWLDGATDLRQVHFLEIWNDPSWPDNQWANPAAVAMWSRWLNAGYRITAIGGSDFHNPQPKPQKDGSLVGRDHLGRPSTYVYAAELSGHAIMAALLARHAYMSMGPTVQFTGQANGRDLLMGDDAGLIDGPLSLKAHVHGIGQLTAQLVKNGIVIQETSAENEVDIEADYPLTPTEFAWFRLDVRTAEGHYLAVTNPIFTGPAPTPAWHTFGQGTAEVLDATS